MSPESSLKFFDNVWESVRGSFSKDVLTDDHKIIPVPSISSATFYDSYSVFVKSKSVFAMLFLLMHKFIIIDGS